MFTELLETLAAYIFFIMVLGPSFIWVLMRKSWEVPYKYRDKHSRHLFENSGKMSHQEDMRQNRKYAKRMNKILLSIGGAGLFLVVVLNLVIIFSE